MTETLAAVGKYRPEMTAVPARIARLPVSRQYPVPWFVQWIDGVPDFRFIDRDKRIRAVRDGLCWICGEVLGRYMTAVVGPMCGINRTSMEPPCHHECALFAAMNCPFLVRPHAKRREVTEMPEGAGIDGHMIERNPGVTLLWTMRGYTTFGDGKGGWLVQFGEPTSMEWWSEGKPASRERVAASVDSGLPILREMCRSSDDLDELARRKKWLETRYPQ